MGIFKRGVNVSCIVLFLILLQIRMIHGADHYYIYLSGSFDYDDAVVACTANGTRIAKITSVEENDAAFATIPDISQSAVWIGLTDSAEEGVFRWEADGSSLNDAGYQNWADSQPDNANDIENCATFAQSSQGQWNEYA
jgi:hypothetical protein